MTDTKALHDRLVSLLPICVTEGRDYAEVCFGDGKTHSTHAMTMNPQDWSVISEALPTILAALKAKEDVEPVAWMYECDGKRILHNFQLKDRGRASYGADWTETPLYAHPKGKADD